MARVVFVGDSDVFASQVAAERLIRCEGDCVDWISTAESGHFADRPTPILRAIGRRMPEASEGSITALAARARLGRADSFDVGRELERIDELWIVCDDLASRQAATIMQNILAALDAGSRCPPAIVFVRSGRSLDDSAIEAIDAVKDRVARIGGVWRAIRTPVLFDAEVESRSGWIGSLLGVLHDLKREIEERHPDFFDYRSLRCHAPSGYGVHLIYSVQAAQKALELIADPAMANAETVLTSREPVDVAALFEDVGMALDLSLLAEQEGTSLGPVDAVLQDRLERIPAPPWENTATGGVEVDLDPVNAQRRGEILAAARASWDEAYRKTDDAAAALFAGTPKRLNSDGRHRVDYYAFGNDGTPVVILNAVCQGLAYWTRLVHRLSQRRRVLIWPQEGDQASLSEQVQVIERVCRNEGVESFHLIGWCTGPKLAIRYCASHPSQVVSMALLNGSYKSAATSKDIESAYERDFESLCAMVERNPDSAGFVSSRVRQSMEGAQLDLAGAGDDDECAADVLAAVNTNLKEAVLTPFRSDASFAVYARQMREFWTYDPSDDAAGLTQPALLLGCEFDKVASPAMALSVADVLPHAEVVEAVGATHYCIYDRAAWVADMLDDFFSRAENSIGDASVAANQSRVSMGQWRERRAWNP